MSNDKEQDLPLPTRVALLEARVRLIAIVLKWLLGGLVTALVTYIVKIAVVR